MMHRRQFLHTSLAAAAASRLSAQDIPDWGGPVLDVHLHGKGPGGEWTHMQGSGVTHAQLLVSPMQEAHVKQEMAAHEGRFHYSVSMDPARDNAVETLRAAIKAGATGFGEMKSRNK